jgi:general stress protein 26
MQSRVFGMGRHMEGLTMRAATFADIEEAFIGRVHAMVWCSLATIDRHGRPRSRIVHPIWDGATGYAGSRRRSPKGNDFTANPHVSLAYSADLVHPVYVDCAARWDDDPDTKRHVWNLFHAAPPPLGYDPGTIYKGIDDPDFGVIRFTPYRIALEDVSGQGERRIIWRPAA